QHRALGGAGSQLAGILHRSIRVRRRNLLLRERRAVALRAVARAAHGAHRFRCARRAPALDQCGGATGVTDSGGNCAMAARSFGSSVVMMSLSLPIVAVSSLRDRSSVRRSASVGTADDASRPPRRSYALPMVVPYDSPNPRCTAESSVDT